LTPILAGAQILKSSLKEEIDSQLIKDYITIIERQAKNMEKLLDDLLDISRIDRKKITLNKELVDIALIVKRATEATLPLLKEKIQVYLTYKYIRGRNRYWIEYNKTFC